MIIGQLPGNTNATHPVERVMDNAFSKMRSLVDADVIIGTPVMTADGASIIPINSVSMGFLTGGGEYSDLARHAAEEYPFAGGSGAGVTVKPICFLVSDGSTVKLINVDERSTFDKFLAMLPETLGKMMGSAVGGAVNGAAKNMKKK